MEHERNVTFSLPHSLVLALRIQAARSGGKQKDIVRIALERELAKGRNP